MLSIRRCGRALTPLASHARAGNEVRARGLTLVEALVTLGVIGVLLGVLVPVLASARGSARRVVCQSNLRQIHPPIMAYRDTHRGLLPPAYDLFSVQPGWLAPLDALAPYLDAPLPRLDRGEVVISAPWLCPADDVTGPYDGLSYLYAPHQMMGIVGAEWVTRQYESEPSRPVFHDAFREFHNGSLNTLRFDGSIGSLPVR